MTDPAALVHCPHDELCGACFFLGRPYAEQLRVKRERLLQAFDRILDLRETTVLETLPSPMVSGYRNRAKMAIEARPRRPARLGYFQRRSRDVVDATDCKVIVPALLDTTRRLRSLLSQMAVPNELAHLDLRCGSDPERQHLTLVLHARDELPLPVQEIRHACPSVSGMSVNLNPEAGRQVIKGRIDHLVGEREVWVQLPELRLRVSPGSFFQVNLSILEAVHERMGAFFGRGRLLVDLYAGVGTHGLALCQRFDAVVCVEGVRIAAADTRASIDLAGLDHVEVVGTRVNRPLRGLLDRRPDAMVLNPSRQGVEERVLGAIGAARVPKIAYLSCDPSTLARDLAVLAGAGYAVDSLQPVDMMPQTLQVEALALLRYVGARGGPRPRPRTGRGTRAGGRRRGRPPRKR